MAQASNLHSIEEVKRLFRPSGALLAAVSNLGSAIECLAVAKTQHSSAILDLLVRLRFAPDGQLRGIDLVSQLHMSPGYVSRLIDQAETDGLISRQTDPRDRRAQLIKLTPEGEQAFNEFVPPVLEVLDETIYSELSADEVEAFVDFLERIAARSQEFLDQPNPDG
ncbi:MAG: MarR family transcriptional regulator [Actinomycetia bacterium]|nr:MarR family transcriptional regulator [Actinomycetes bacterium]